MDNFFLNSSERFSCKVKKQSHKKEVQKMV